MTKYLTTAAWAALVLGGVAVAETPPAESTEVTTETTTEVMTEAPTEVTTTYRYGDKAEVETTEEAAGTIASVTIEGEVDADAETEEAADVEMTEEVDVDVDVEIEDDEDASEF